MAHNDFSIGEHVRWTWGRGEGRGWIAERVERRAERVIKGRTIIRNGSPENPAYVIEQGNGAEVLKLGSELSAA